MSPTNSPPPSASLEATVTPVSNTDLTPSSSTGAAEQEPSQPVQPALADNSESKEATSPASPKLGSTSVSASKKTGGGVIIEEVNSDDEPEDGDEVPVERPLVMPTDEDIEARIAKAMASVGGGSTPAPPAASQAPPTHDWQAVWSAPQNAYYFFNRITLETTWVNPLVDPRASAPTPPTAPKADRGGSSPVWDPAAETLPTAGPSSGSMPRAAPTTSFSYASPMSAVASSMTPTSTSYVEPSLKHLLPPSYNPLDSSTYTAQARFNSRTGRYENPSNSSRTPDHLSDAARMHRQNSRYFDQDAYEREREAEFARQQEEDGPAKKKRNTKKDIESFKAKREAKKSMRNAWLRS